MNEETSRYVFRIMALKEIMNSPTKYGFDVNKKRVQLIPTRKIEIDTSITDLVALLKHKE
jgi:plasmid replication initiation protein